MRDPLHLKTLVPDEVRAALERDPRLLVPVGTCEQHGPHLPLGCDTILVERLADDLSAEFRILRAPTVEYGVNTATKRPYPGNATVRRKTLHRWIDRKSTRLNSSHLVISYAVFCLKKKKKKKASTRLI